MKDMKIEVYINEDIDYKDMERSQERIDSSGEIFTPEEIVNRILDEVNPEDWSNMDKTILEPSCGDGNFVIKIIERFMVGLSDIIPTEEDRFRHIIENQVYALDIMSDNINATLNRIDSVYGFNVRGLKHNILCKDSISYDYAFGKNWEDDYGFQYTAESKDIEKKVSRKKKKTINVANLSDFE